jgi:hypothetical protein
MIGYLRNASRSPKGPNIRVGGDSSDHTIYRDDCTGVPLPSGITYCSSLSDLKALEGLSTVNGSVTIGLNLGHNVVGEAVAYATAVNKRVELRRLVESYEIGNEPDLYASNGLRPITYNYSGYSNDFYAWFEALRTETNITFPAVQGAVFCCDLYDLWLAEYMEAYESKGFFTSISYHHYPLIACDHMVVTLSELLSPYAASSVAYYAPFATISRRYGKPFYIGEGNSVSCGGAFNVSNTFGAALWAIDALFNAASSNITRWNFHGCAHSSYSPIWLSNADDEPAMAQPLFYGMWGFTWLIAGGARVLRSDVPAAADPAIVAWSTRSDTWASVEGSICSVRVTVVVLDKRFSSNATATDVVVKFEGLNSSSEKTAQVRLMAPFVDGVAATGNITFGGLTFEGSTTGFPIGQENVTTVALSSNGTLLLTSVPGSATFVELLDGCSER